MTSLRRGVRSVPRAPLGPLNPLPPLLTGWDIHQVDDAGDVLPEIVANAKFGRVDSVLPYQPQDGYSRDRVQADVEVVVLENERVRAEFMPQLGGRLWSLTVDGREVLHVNPILQPAHFALRDAWMAGGTEWNIGTIGHTVMTCEPLHAVAVETPEGPLLRMYAYERLRGVTYRVEAWLPPEAPVLAVHVSITNPTDHVVPMYWWSNTAVPEADDVRVLAPADSAWTFAYDGGLAVVPIPGPEDVTYSTRAPHAADHFFDVGTHPRPWVTALDGAGTGLAQASTDRLRGRKLFVWGTNRGADRWQEMLSGPDSRYLEIQAGLARTQTEHVPMPAATTWSWVEAYGLAHADAAQVHGADWPAAVAAGERAVADMLGDLDLEAALGRVTAWADLPGTEVFGVGSDWGALHQALVGDAEAIATPGAPFATERDDATAPWWALLEGATDWSGDPAQPPVSYQIDPRWADRLDGVTGWQAALHRGVIALAAGDKDGARGHWRDSLAQTPNAWAHRGLAALAANAGDTAGAAAAYRDAVALAPDCAPLLVEAYDALLADGAAAEVLAATAALPADLAGRDRFRLARARAAVAAGDVEVAAGILPTLKVDNLREGDNALDRLWADWTALRGVEEELPAHLDLRMQ